MSGFWQILFAIAICTAFGLSTMVALSLPEQHIFTARYNVDDKVWTFDHVYDKMAWYHRTGVALAMGVLFSGITISGVYAVKSGLDK